MNADHEAGETLHKNSKHRQKIFRRSDFLYHCPLHLGHWLLNHDHHKYVRGLSK